MPVGLQPADGAASPDNIADMFTKAMKNANDFHWLRRIVMNEQ